MVSKEVLVATNFPAALSSLAGSTSSSVIPNKEVVVADALTDFDVRTVQSTDDQAAVHLELHVQKCRSFPCGGDVLGQLRGRDQGFRDRNVVIRDEDNLHQVPDFGSLLTTSPTAVTKRTILFAWMYVAYALPPKTHTLGTTFALSSLDIALICLYL